MSVAAEAVAFLGTEGLIATGAAVWLGHQLITRVAAPKQPSNGNGSRNARTPAAAAEAPREPIDVLMADGKTAADGQVPRDRP